MLHESQSWREIWLGSWTLGRAARGASREAQSHGQRKAGPGRRCWGPGPALILQMMTRLPQEARGHSKHRCSQSNSTNCPASGDEKWGNSSLQEAARQGEGFLGAALSEDEGERGGTGGNKPPLLLLPPSVSSVPAGRCADPASLSRCTQKHQQRWLNLGRCHPQTPG